MEHFPKSDFPTKKQKSIFGTVTIINYALNHDKRNCIGPREAARGPRLFLFCIYEKNLLLSGPPIEVSLDIGWKFRIDRSTCECVISLPCTCARPFFHTIERDFSGLFIMRRTVKCRNALSGTAMLASWRTCWSVAKEEAEEEDGTLSPLHYY